jgi:sigma-54 dependent transcriptional regulator, acetoin dehydrogenase operon transcriptional activator AcoR
VSGSPEEPDDAIRPHIASRWRWCREHHIDPGARRAPTALSAEILTEILANADLGIAGKEILADFAHVVHRTKHIIVVADAHGRIIHGVGDPETWSAVESLNFAPGGLWSEDAVGPNGIGTALTTGRTGLVFGPEHFCEGWQPWVCYGSPIRDPATGVVVGAVDISGRARDARWTALDLTAVVARSVERTLGGRSLRRRQALIEEYLSALRRWPNDGVMLVDETGKVLEISTRGAQILRQDLRLLLGQQLENSLPELSDIFQSSWSAGGTQETTTQHSQVRAHVHCSPVIIENRAAGSLMILRPVEHHELVAMPSRAGTVHAGAQRIATWGDILGESRAIANALRLAEISASNGKTVLLTGETGTGKELFAQAIHSASSRADGPFIAVNCAALPRDLFESELFGYASGAFTGARREGARGRFEQADGGTLFLDEISSLPFDLQSKLLRVLESKLVTRLGCATPRHVDARVIAASNEELTALVAAGRFRADLYYRLNVMSVRIPPLRERPEDILFLVKYFLAQERQHSARPPLMLSPAVEEVLVHFDWPGNVRELRNLCERWAAQVIGHEITLNDVPHEMGAARRFSSAAERAVVDAGTVTVDDLLAALEASGNNVSATARKLGVSRTTVYNKLRLARERTEQRRR